MPIETVRTPGTLRARIAGWRAEGLTVGLVPTMGALHDGHLTLIRRAQEEVDRVCATIFVNPTQFAPSEDFAVYPRDEGRDVALLAGEGTNLLFSPTVETMYGPGHVTRVSLPGLGDELEGAFRPGFFTGVATVVTMLLSQAGADVAVFGEKDYQQLLVIRRLATDLHIPTRIVGAPTLRESDGLALSSRNAYLSKDERSVAPALHRVLSRVALRVRGGAEVGAETEAGKAELVEGGFDKVDYLDVRSADTLAPVSRIETPARVLAAAWLGKTRLIDNVEV